MPSRSRIEPSRIEAAVVSATPRTPHGVVRPALHVFLGLLAFCVLVTLSWTPLLTHLPVGWIEMVGGVTEFRLLGAALFGALLLAWVLTGPPEPPTRRSVAWGEFANATGGTVSRRRGRRRGMSVSWSRHGSEVRLGTITDTNRNEHTQFTAVLALRNGFQFHLAPKNGTTKALFSAELWDLALAAVKSEARRRGGAPTSAGVAERLWFLTAKEILIGDPRFDNAYSLRSDAPGLARELLGDPGVLCRVQELDRKCTGWQVSLMSRDGSSAYQLTLAVPGAIVDPERLDAGWKLMEASIRGTADRGMLPSEDLERHGSGPVGGPAAVA